jgi:hypothetical protein
MAWHMSILWYAEMRGRIVLNFLFHRYIHAQRAYYILPTDRALRGSALEQTESHLIILTIWLV